MSRVLYFIIDWILLPVCTMAGIATMIIVGAGPLAVLFGGMALGFIVAVPAAISISRIAKLKECP